MTGHRSRWRAAGEVLSSTQDVDDATQPGFEDTLVRQFAREDVDQFAHEDIDDATQPGREDTVARQIARGIDIPGYEVTGVLGMGGFGIVWDAVRESDRLPVAIKSIHSDQPLARERLSREAAALRTIGPPYVPFLFHEGRLASGAPFFVCERLSMPTLADSLGRPMLLSEFMAYAVLILKALQHVHDKGLLHRDLKPDNIFVQRDPPVVKLIDFGLTKHLPDPKRVSPQGPFSTTSGMVLGTPLYMSPEQCEGKAHIDERADIYALGVVFYEMLTGAPPFTGDPAEVRMAHIGQRPSPMSRRVRMPRPLDELIARCLSKAPARRPSSAAELARALGDIASRHAFDPASLGSPEVIPSLPTVRVPPSHHTVALLYFETESSTALVQKRLATSDGRIASIQGPRCIAAFGVESRENPMELALDAAEDLIERGLVRKVVVDRAQARIHVGPDGTKRVLTSALYRRDRFPTDAEPPGILITMAVEGAAAAIRSSEVLGRPNLRRLDGRGIEDEPVARKAPTGREPTTRALLGSANMAFSNRLPTISTLLGETGYGKSSIGSYLAFELQRATPPVRVIALRARPSRNRASKHTLAEFARVAMAAFSAEHTAKLPSGMYASRDGPLQLGRAILRELIRDLLPGDQWLPLAQTLGWVSLDTHDRENTGSRALSGRERAVGELLRYLAKMGSLACILDDAHLADEATLDALEYATEAQCELPIWVCTLAGTSFQQARPNWGMRAGKTRSHRLRRLDAHSAAMLCRQLLKPAENIPQRVIARLVAETRGNPWLLTELANGIHRQNLIRKHGRGDSWYLDVDELDALPELPRVEWLVERELGSLPEHLAAHAGLMAVLSSEISEIEVEGVLRELEFAGMGADFPLDAWVSTSRLIERSMLVRQMNRRLTFRHEILRKRVERSLPQRVARAVHEAAFRYYRDTEDVGEQRRLHSLAYHAARCEQKDSASAIYLHLAEWSRQRHDILGAKALYTKAIDIMPRTNQRMSLRAYSGRGLMNYQISRFSDALDDLRRARGLAEALNDERSRVELLLDEATVLDWTQDFHVSQELVERAADIASDLQDPLLSARVNLGLGRARVRVRDPAPARELLERAVTQAQALGDAGYQTLVTARVLLGGALIAQADYAAAAEILDRAIQSCGERGDKLQLAVALDQRRALGVWRGHLQDALADGMRAQLIGRELGQIAIEYATAYHLAELHGFEGDFEAALQQVRRAVEIEPTSAKVPRALLLEARLHLLAGDFHQARRTAGDLRSSLDRAQEGGDPDALFTPEDHLLFEALKLASQRASLSAWRKFLDALDTDPVTHAQILETTAMTRARVGDDKRANKLLKQARALCADLDHVVKRRLEMPIPRR